jgi:RND superfamily putative drug exporter
MFRAIGPSVAIAVALMLAAGLTLAPALMRLCGAALFWPTRPRWTAALQRDGVPRGVWHTVGRVIVRRPLSTLVGCLVLLAPLAAFAAALSPSYDDLRTLPASNPAVKAALAVQTHFGSITESDTLVVSYPSGDLTRSAGSEAVRRLRDALRSDQAVRQVGTAVISPNGHAAAVALTLAVETSSPEAHRVVGRLQAALATTTRSLGLPGMSALLSGDSPRTHDEATQVADDFRFILVWITLIIFGILVLMVRSLTAPLYLLATVALSAGSAVGLTVLVFHEILGQEIYYTTPVFAFVFLVALGEDFNILLMSRIREEVARRGLRAGVARAVGRTGATLSNCGLIMAGTFGVLMQFDVTFLRQIGFAVAAGVLLDTFIIRPLLMPSIVVLLGRWNWVTVRGVVPLPQPAGNAEPVAIG